MASRAVSLWRSVRVGFARSMTSATAPRMKPLTSTASDFAGNHNRGSFSKALKADFVPVYVTLGFVLLAMTFAAHTAKQQIVYAPGVRVNKKRRETMAEVVEPDRVEAEADRFINKSIFRRVAHVQDFDAVRSGVSDPTRGPVVNKTRRVESLKSVGVDL
ncbi:hypothetical protein J5N97_007074 [Dioscorea zingiberensis]|uniref:Uncharacterized protein n=1 Tax=Dioscorea zingiberensis TaxID=325984 RepID=A0A9D5DCU1_9LILI|nr:hypothetical protein J5N97_007074 [Dioscorea zingiberensis]